jgi:hypothetical protein
MGWRAELVEAGASITEIIDRQYFTFIYFHVPGGLLLGIATDQPGFTVDEPLLELGRELNCRRGWSPAGNRSPPPCRRCGCPITAPTTLPTAPGHRRDRGCART